VYYAKEWNSVYNHVRDFAYFDTEYEKYLLEVGYYTRNHYNNLIENPDFDGEYMSAGEFADKYIKEQIRSFD